MGPLESNDDDPVVAISTEKSGFYKGFNRVVALVPKLLVVALVIWVGLSPSAAGQVLLSVQNWSTVNFAGWYVYVTAFYTVVCLALGLWPRTAHVRLGKPGDKPEFTMFSWLSMMFGATFLEGRSHTISLKMFPAFTDLTGTANGVFLLSHITLEIVPPPIAIF